jgi:uncharacterized protein
MSSLLTAIGLVFVIEGLLYALAPHVIKRMMVMMQNLPVEQLRFAGLVVATAGVAMVWLVRMGLG